MNLNPRDAGPFLERGEALHQSRFRSDGPKPGYEVILGESRLASWITGR